MNRLIIFTFILGLSLSSCLLPSENGKVSLSLSSSDQTARDSAKSSRASVTQVKLVNDQIVIFGADLDGVVKAKVSQSGSNSTLSIISQSASELILSSSAKVALALNTLMSLTLEDAYGATVVEVTFNLPDSSVSTDKIGDAQITSAKIADGAITAVKLSQMSAGVGQLLRWNGTSWVASDLDALTYAGTWDASIGGDPNPAAVGGEYYIVSADGVADPGDGNSRTWAQGDWIVFNDNTSSWDQISNSSDVTSFEGRTGGVTAQTGDYTWAMIDKTTSSIGDIADVDLSTPATTGKVLKFDGTNWIADDDLSGGGAGSVSSTEIADGSIVDADVSGSAAIAWSKINKSGAVASDVGLGNVDNIQQIPLSYLDTTTTLGSDNAKIPSQNAVKTYVDAQVASSVTSITGGAGLTDGPYTTTGTIDVQVDGSTIEVSADALRLKDGGITNAKVNASAAIAWSKIDKTGAIKSDVGLGNVDNIQQMPLSYLSTNTSLGTSNVLVPTQNAVQSYVDTQVGNVNASQWTTSGANIHYSSGNVGIGSTMANSNLHIVGDYQISSSNTELSYAQSKYHTLLLYRTLGNSDGDYTELVQTIGRYNENLNIEFDIIDNLAGGGISQKYKITANFDDYNSVTDLEWIEVLPLMTSGSRGGSNYRLETRRNVAAGQKMEFRLRQVGSFGAGDHPVSIAIRNYGSELIELTGSGNDLVYSSTQFRQGALTLSQDEVGVGTKAPAGKLHIQKGAVGTSPSSLYNEFVIEANEADVGMNILSLASSRGVIAFGDVDNSSIGKVEYDHNNDSLQFHANNSEKMIIKSDGKVGIGVTNPATELEVAGTITATGFSGPIVSSSVTTSSGNVSGPSYSFNGDTDTGFYSESANTIEVSVGGTNIFDLNSAGMSSSTTGGGFLKTAAGTAGAPTFSYAGDTDTGWYRVAEDKLGASTGGELRMLIDDSGSVGIGTSSPTGFLTGTGSKRLQIKSSNGSAEVNIDHGGISSGHSSGVSFSSSGTPVGYIKTEKSATSAIDGGLAFGTHNGSSLSEKMRLSRDGYLGVGTSDPAIKIQAEGPGGESYSGSTTTQEFGLPEGTLLYLKDNSASETTDRFVGLGFSGEGPGGATRSAHIGAVPAATGHKMEIVFGQKVSNTSHRETMRIDSDGNVGIGTVSPVSKLEVADGAIETSGAGGFFQVGYDTSDSSLGKVSFHATHKSSTDRYFTGLQYNNSGGAFTLTTSGNTIFDSGDSSSYGNHIFRKRGWDGSAQTFTESMRIDSDGNVGIGTPAPSEALHVSGNVLAAGYLYTSDRRFKKNIKTLEDPLEKILQLRGVSFDWRVEEFPERKFPKERTVGFIAQEVEQSTPEIVKTAGDGYKSVQYGNITSLLVEASKKLYSKIQELFTADKKIQRKIASLEEENEKLKRDMQELKDSMKELQESQKNKK